MTAEVQDVLTRHGLREGRLLLGTWQQIVLVDFDTRPRRRDLVVQLSGE